MDPMRVLTDIDRFCLQVGEMKGPRGEWRPTEPIANAVHIGKRHRLLAGELSPHA